MSINNHCILALYCLRKIRLVAVFLYSLLQCALFIPDILNFKNENRTYVIWRLVCSLIIVGCCVIYGVLIQYTSIDKKFPVLHTMLFLTIVGTVSICVCFNFIYNIIDVYQVYGIYNNGK